MTGARVYLAVGAMDLRGTFDKLAALTRQVLAQDPRSGALFLFVNRRKDRVKVLWWDRNGYVILYKRLAQGTFAVPSPSERTGCIELSPTQLSRLLGGLPLDLGTLH